MSYEGVIACHFCGAARTTTQAVNDGWTPEWVDDSGAYRLSPVCPACTAVYLADDGNGEMQSKQ